MTSVGRLHTGSAPSRLKRSMVLELELEVYGALLRPGWADELEGTLETQMKAWHL